VLRANSSRARGKGDDETTISGSPGDVVFTHQQHVELLFETVISTVAAPRNSVADERSMAVHSAS
jgi:hypothetical protein